MTDKRLTLVTGASRGIGRALALELALKHGHHVLALARSKKSLEDLDDEIKSAGGSATLIPMDLGDANSILQLSAIVLERWGRLDGLVGNAGILGPISPIQTVSPKSWDDVLNINLTANWRLIRSFDHCYVRAHLVVRFLSPLVWCRVRAHSGGHIRRPRLRLNPWSPPGLRKHAQPI